MRKIKILFVLNQHFKFLSGILLFLVSNFTFGDWTVEELHHLKKYPNQFDDPDFALLWWGVYSQTRNKGMFRFPEGEEKEVSHPNFKDSLKYLEGLQRDSSGKIKKAPLVFMVNGIFQDHLKDMNSPRTFFKKGYHVVFLPTSLTRAYFDAAPKNFEPGDIFSEATMLHSLMETLLNKIGRENIVEVNYWGVSFGATLGNIVRFIDSQNSSNKIIDGDFLLIAPIMNMIFAVEKFDQWIVAFRSGIGRESLGELREKIRAYFSINNRQDPRLVKNAMSIQSEALVGATTQANVRKMVDLFEERHGKRFVRWENKNSMQKKFRSSFEQRSFIRNSRRKFDRIFLPTGTRLDLLGLKESMKVFIPGLIEKMKSPLGTFAHWYDATKALGVSDRNIKVLQSMDDPLMDPVEMQKFEKANFFHVLGSGGHIGYTSIPWYLELLNRVYQ